MVLAVWVMERLDIEPACWNFLQHIPRILQQLPKFRWRCGTAGETAAAAHYGNGLAGEVGIVALCRLASHCECLDMSEGRRREKPDKNWRVQCLIGKYVL